MASPPAPTAVAVADAASEAVEASSRALAALRRECGTTAVAAAAAATADRDTALGRVAKVWAEDVSEASGRGAGARAHNRSSLFQTAARLPTLLAAADARLAIALDALQHGGAE